MVKPMENVPLYSGLIRLKLMMKGKLGRGATLLFREHNGQAKHQITRHGHRKSVPGGLCVWCGSLQADQWSRWLTGFSEVLCTRIR